MPAPDDPAQARVLVTGAGGPAGIAVLRALLGRTASVAAVDLDPWAPGIRLATDGATVPPYTSDDYVPELCRLADKWGSTVLISTLAEEVATLEAGAALLAEAGLRHWMPPAAAVTTCIDKWQFATALAGTDLPAPATGLASAAGVPGPWVVKPRWGRGSRDVVMVDGGDALAVALATVPEPIVQTRLAGREFTVDALVDRDGHLAGAVPRWRSETKAGISVKGETFALAALVAATARLLAHLGLQGPANVQGFVDAGDRFAFTEVNPRFSGGLPLSLAAGSDLVGEYLRGILGHPLQEDRLAYRPGVRMLRYFEEIFE